jgi:hypothetical protein
VFKWSNICALSQFLWLAYHFSDPVENRSSVSQGMVKNPTARLISCLNHRGNTNTGLLNKWPSKAPASSHKNPIVLRFDENNKIVPKQQQNHVT